MSDQPEQGVGQEGAAAPEAAAAAAAAEQMYRVMVDGNESEVPLSELLAGYQRQQDYTRKTQELSESRKKFGKEVEDRAVELYLKAMENGNGGKGNKAGQEPDFNSKLAELERKLEQTESARKESEANKFIDAMQSELSGKYDKMDWDKVLLRFYNSGGPTEGEDIKSIFDRLAKESHDAELKREQAIIDGYVKKKSSNPHQKGELGGSTSTASKRPEPAKTFEEARERAEQRLRGEL